MRSFSLPDMRRRLNKHQGQTRGHPLALRATETTYSPRISSGRPMERVGPAIDNCPKQLDGLFELSCSIRYGHGLRDVRQSGGHPGGIITPSFHTGNEGEVESRPWMNHRDCYCQLSDRTFHQTLSLLRFAKLRGLTSAGAAYKHRDGTRHGGLVGSRRARTERCPEA